MLNSCNLCKEPSAGVIPISNNGSNGIQFIIKLSDCIPEINWDPDLLICPACQEKTDLVHDFKKQCISSLILRSSETRIEETELEPEVFVCFHCEESFVRKEDLIAHIDSEHKLCPKTARFECSECDRSFGTRALLKRHSTAHSTEKPYECADCSRKFASRCYLRAHQRYHTGNRPYVCLFCGKSFVTYGDLYQHEKIHENKRAYKCLECPKAFNTNSDLHKHKICVHSDKSAWKHECEFCSRKFPLRANLVAHRRTHTGERRHPCHLCDARCANAASLRRHVASHSNERPFACELCAKPYKSRRTLEGHKARAHGVGTKAPPVREKRFFCAVCSTGYRSDGQLRKHVRTHTGERPFACPDCGKAFIDRSYVRQHARVAHDKEF